MLLVLIPFIPSNGECHSLPVTKVYYMSRFDTIWECCKYIIEVWKLYQNFHEFYIDDLKCSSVSRSHIAREEIFIVLENSKISKNLLSCFLKAFIPFCSHFLSSRHFYIIYHESPAHSIYLLYLLLHFFVVLLLASKNCFEFSTFIRNCDDITEKS